MIKLYEPQLIFSKHVFEPGIHDIDIKVYHDSAGISRSGIIELKKSPLHYYHAYLSSSKVRKDDTKAMVLGDAVHTKIMEPHLFEERFTLSEKFDCRTSKGKEDKYQFELANQGKRLIDSDQYLIIKEIEKEIQKQPLVHKLLKDAQIEKSLFWVDSETELLCKSRPDIWTPKYIVDIKTTSDSTYSAFCRSVINYGYYIQAAMIIDGIREITGCVYHNFVFIALQTTPPYKPYLYNLGDAEIEHGRKEYKKLLRVLRACFEKDKWDLDRDHVTEINLPGYFFNEQFIENMMEVYQCQN